MRARAGASNVAAWGSKRNLGRDGCMFAQWHNHHTSLQGPSIDERGPRRHVCDHASFDCLGAKRRAPAGTLLQGEEGDEVVYSADGCWAVGAVCECWPLRSMQNRWAPLRLCISVDASKGGEAAQERHLIYVDTDQHIKRKMEFLLGEGQDIFFASKFAKGLSRRQSAGDSGSPGFKAKCLAQALSAKNAMQPMK